MSFSSDPRSYLVPRHLRGGRVEDVLEAWMPGVRRTALRRLILDGHVRCNGRRVQRTASRLKEGDLLQIDEAVSLEGLPSFHGRKKEVVPRTLYQDDSCLALSKPPGLPAVPQRSGQGSIQEYLNEWFGDHQDLRVVHRLDKETSGVLLLAKGKDAARELDRQFRERRVEKLYLALVRGQPRGEEFECQTMIGKTLRGGRVRLGKGKGAREARTEFRVLERFRGFALLQARPHTGRMHQIRAHLMSMGHPLAVDPLYGRVEALFLSEFKVDFRKKPREMPLLDRLSLHAKSLRFRSPGSGEEIRVEAALPGDLARTLEKLRRWADPGRVGGGGRP